MSKGVKRSILHPYLCVALHVPSSPGASYHDTFRTTSSNWLHDSCEKRNHLTHELFRCCLHLTDVVNDAPLLPYEPHISHTNLLPFSR